MLTNNITLLRKNLHLFFRWLGLRPDDYNLEFVDDSGDWIAAPTSRGIRFNLNLLKNVEGDFPSVVLIHEAWHILMQKIPLKLDAKIVKDSFSDKMMALFDIEADVVTFSFLREAKGLSLKQVFNLQYIGQQVFRDRIVRIPKFERFLGSILSTTYQFQYRQRGLFLPDLSSFGIDGQIRLIGLFKDNLQFVTVELNQRSMGWVRSAYQNGHELTVRDYTRALMAFSQEVLAKVMKQNNPKLRVIKSLN